MPILDHLNEEITDIVEFNSFHHHWAAHIAEDLNKILPRGFRARAHAWIGVKEVDVRTDKSLTADEKKQLMPQYKLPVPLAETRAEFPIDSQVFVENVRRRRQKTVGVIEIVSAGNKDRPDNRNTFVAKCRSFLSHEISVIIVDILAVPFFNLHNLLLRAFKIKEGQIKEDDETPLYCGAYRKTFIQDEPGLVFWAYSLKIGDRLPELPLFITSELAVPVELERAYMETCQGLKVFEE